MNIPESIQPLLCKIKDDVAFHKLQYYIRSMKKAPHGGVFHISKPGVFLSYYPCSTFNYLNPNLKMPLPIKLYKTRLSQLMREFQIEVEDLLVFCFRVDNSRSNDPVFGDPVAGDKLYTAMVSNVLLLKDEIETSYENAVMNAAYGANPFTDVFDIDLDRLAEVFICFILRINLYSMKELQDVLAVESLDPKHDKYGLTNITSASFERQGYCIGEKYYLYNLLFDTSIGGPTASVPKIIELMQSIKDVDIYMRCDETLSVPLGEKVSSASWDMQKWRGITLNTENIEAQISTKKEIIVHYNPSTMNKLLLIVKPEIVHGNRCFQISVEQLWNPDSINHSEQNVQVNYLHGCFFPTIHSFDHIDFSVNQYRKADYVKKYQDAVATTSVSIEQYADLHYKVWCIKGPKLSMHDWAELVTYSLDEPFRELFVEAIGASLIEQER